MDTIKSLFKVRDLRKKISFVLLVLLIYKMGTYITVPGVDSSVLKNMGDDGGILGFANAMTGGAIANFSIFAIGIMPYITASIIIQLLSMDIVPTLAEWAKQGEDGRKKTKSLTRKATVILAFIQSFLMSFGFNNLYPGLLNNTSIGTYLMIAITMTLGTVLLMVMGEMIDKKGIGNGISMIIFAGIVMTIPQSISMYYTTEIYGAGENLFIALVKTGLLLLFLLLTMVAILYVHKAERRIPVQYTQSQAGDNTGRAFKSYLPIKLNAAGVIPVIFAVSFVMVPMTVSQFFPDNDLLMKVSSFLNYQNPTGMVFYGAVIIFFTYFYAFIQMNPEKMADNLKKSGGFVPGIRPGKNTEIYIHRILGRLTFVGSLFLAIVAVLPVIVGKVTGLPMQIQIGGISLIIVVSVALDAMSQAESHLTKRSYKGFLK